MRTIRSATLLSAAVVAGMLAASSYAWLTLSPDARIPLGWSESGAVIDTVAKPVGLLLIPALTAVISAILAVPSASAENMQRNWKPYRAIWFGLLGFLAVLHSAIVASSLGYAVPTLPLVVAALGFSVMLLGNVLAKSDPQFPMGMEVPQQLHDPTAWSKAHRSAAPIVMLTGLATMAAPWFIGAKMAAMVLIGGLLVATALGFMRARNVVPSANGSE